ncbi:MAG: hypothetical protein V1903_04590 [Bacteroidota bacterium]
MIQVILASVLGLIAIVLGKRVVSGNDCSGCPGNGICKGETDCSIFLSENK